MTDEQPIEAKDRAHSITHDGVPLATNDFKAVEAAGGTKEQFLAYAEIEKPSIIKSALMGGTVLGSMFVMATPMLQLMSNDMGKSALPTWKSFKASAPKIAAIGFAVGALGNGYRALRGGDKINRATKEVLIDWDNSTGRNR